MAAISIPAKSTVHKKALLFGLLCALIFIGPNLVLAQSEIPSHDQPSHKPLDTGPVPMFDITPSGAAGMMTAQAPDVTPNPINWTKFVYQTYLTGNWEIFSNTANMMYDHSINVSSHPAADARPNLSARAARIAFNSDRNGDVEIYLMNFDGSAVEQVTYAPGADYAPSWSPDSGSLAFVSERDGNEEIYRIDLTTRISQRLTNDLAADRFPSWSPDGSQLVWVKYAGDVGTIWIMNKDGSNPHSIFSGLFLQHPSWSPDGAKIAFDADIDGDMMNEIASVRPDGSDLQPIYDTGPGTMEVWMGNWSSDGTWIIYTQIWYGIDDGQIWEIDTDIVQVRLSDSYRFYSVNDAVSMLPNWQIMDDQAPVSAVRPLPAYSRASGFAVDWWGSDFGVSGVFGYDIQTRTGPAGVWGDWLPATENTAEEFTGTAGDTVYFRSRAIDNAANVETWPGASGGDTFTTLFTWLLSGTVRDNRSISVPNADILMAPSALSEVGSDAYGHYAAYLATTGDHVASASHPGYGLLNDLKQEMNVDREHTFVLPPQDNLIVNGEFEDHMIQLPGWQTGGILPTAVSTETVYSGDQSALLGENCPAPCLAVPEPFSVDSFMMERPVLVVDAGGNVAMIWYEHMDKIRYAFRSVTTGWQAPVVVGNNDYGAAKIHMVQDSSGNLYATWGGESVSFIEKTPTGNWSTPTVISQGSNQELLIDQDDNLYSFYVDQDHLAYRKRTPDRIWQPAVAVSVGSARSDGSSAAIGKDGTIHFLWENQFDLYYRSLAPDGVLSAVTQLMPEQTVRFNNVIVDSNGNPSVLALIAENSVEYYQMSSRSPSGNWSDPVRLPFSAAQRSGYQFDRWYPCACRHRQ